MTEQHKRIICLDYGSKTVGVAVTDSLGLTVQPVETIWRESENKLRRTLARIGELIEQYDTDRIVIGLPYNMDDTVGQRAEKALEFAQKIEKRFGIKPIMHDERLSTESAKEILGEMGITGRESKQYIDKIAAVCILEDYLNERK